MTGGIISDLVRVGIGTGDGFHDAFDMDSRFNRHARALGWANPFPDAFSHGAISLIVINKDDFPTD